LVIEAGSTWASGSRLASSAPLWKSISA